MLLQILKSIFGGTALMEEADRPAETATPVELLPPDVDGNPRFLNIGCGAHRIEGFINIDLDAPEADLHLDVTRGLPFEDQSIDGIRSEHFIEHLSKADAYVFMREARRVLKKDGVMRIATPNLCDALDSYRSGVKMEWEREFGYEWIQTRCEMVNIAMRDWGRQWLYDKEELAALGAQTGFHLLGWRELGSSAVERFRRIDYRKDSMIAEFIPAHGIRSNDVCAQPKVSILIPAYNPKYFEQALRSAVDQDYPNLEIIVADDSSGEMIESITARYPAVNYIRNIPRSGPAFNYQTLFRLANGKYIKYLNDDDVLLPGCVSTMAKVLTERPNISLVTSYRQLIDSEGRPLPDAINVPLVRKANGVLHGQYAAHIMVSNRWNYIGEPSTTMFRKCQLADFGPELFDFFGKEILGNVDMVMWLKLLSVGDLCYCAKPLSQFRRHPEQIQCDPGVIPFLVESLQTIMDHAQRVGLHAIVPTQVRGSYVEV